LSIEEFFRMLSSAVVKVKAILLTYDDQSVELGGEIVFNGIRCLLKMASPRNGSRVL
jgi:hypothetical protein